MYYIILHGFQRTLTVLLSFKTKIEAEENCKKLKKLYPLELLYVKNWNELPDSWYTINFCSEEVMADLRKLLQEEQC